MQIYLHGIVGNYNRRIKKFRGKETIFFRKINSMNLRNSNLIGFSISNKTIMQSKAIMVSDFISFYSKEIKV